MIKVERTSSILHSSSRESIKENRAPEANQKRRSPDEGIQSAPESQRSSKRSDSIEIISSKVMEIDITDDDGGKMLPPPLPLKKGNTKKTRTKQNKKPEVVEEALPGGLRITRSKIKQEKVSIDPVSVSITVQPPEPVLEQSSLVSIESKKGKKVKVVTLLESVEPET